MNKFDHPFEAENSVGVFDEAEENRDPLDGLMERATIDPGAPFAPEVLEQLAALQKHDRAAFETLRAQLKEAGCRVTVLDQAIADLDEDDENSNTGGRRPKEADILIGLAQLAELFHAADGTGFVDLDVNGHRETWPIGAKGFRQWLLQRYFEDDRRSAEFRGRAIGAKRDRGQGAFRRTGAEGSYSCRWA